MQKLKYEKSLLAQNLPPPKKNTFALFWVITQRVVVISYRRFGTTFRSHFQRSRIHREL